MKILITVITWSVLGAELLLAQENIDDYEMVGFACMADGSPSRPVVKVADYLDDRDYASVARLLTSSSNAERYLAAICLERLNKLRKYTLTVAQLKLIAGIRCSEELVPVCSGCTYWDRISLRKLCEDNPLYAEHWLRQHIDKN